MEPPREPGLPLVRVGLRRRLRLRLRVGVRLRLRLRLRGREPGLLFCF